MELPAIIRHLRQSLEWSQENLAHESGVSQGEICKIEKGNIKPTSDIINKIAKAFKMSGDELIKFDIKKNPCYLKYVNVVTPQSDEEALILKFYIQFENIKDSEDKHEHFRKLFFAMEKEVLRKENYLKLIRSTSLKKLLKNKALVLSYFLLLPLDFTTAFSTVFNLLVASSEFVAV